MKNLRFLKWGVIYYICAFMGLFLCATIAKYTNLYIGNLAMLVFWVAFSALRGDE